MEKIEIRAYAKINMSLSAGKRESSNFHPIHSLVLPIDLCDTVFVRRREDGIVRVKCGNIPAENNTAYKAAKAFSTYFNTPGADIVVEKKIPVGGGLGGSSADAAAVLKAMSLIYEIEDFDAVENIAQNIGKDVPVMLSGEACIVSGYGEVCESVELETDAAAVIVTCPYSNDTSLIYSTFDDLVDPVLDCERAYKLLEKLRAGDLSGATAFMKNDLALPAYTANPEMSAIRDRLVKLGYHPFVTGSGSCQFIFTPSYAGAYSTAQRLSGAFNVFPVRFLI